MGCKLSNEFMYICEQERLGRLGLGLHAAHGLRGIRNMCIWDSWQLSQDPGFPTIYPDSGFSVWWRMSWGRSPRSDQYAPNQ